MEVSITFNLSSSESHNIENGRLVISQFPQPRTYGGSAATDYET